MAAGGLRAGSRPRPTLSPSGDSPIARLAAHGSLLFLPVTEIGLVEVSGSVHEPSVSAPPPLELADRPKVILRFLVSVDDWQGLEALRDARRALIREEGTRGRDPEEPSLEEAVFSSTEIEWEVHPEQRAWCLKKLAELRRRANELLSEIGPERPTA